MNIVQLYARLEPERQNAIPHYDDNVVCTSKTKLIPGATQVERTEINI